MNCPKDLNSFLLDEPLFTNTFPDNECEQRKFYGGCFHCFATSIRRRDKQLINSVLDEIRAEIEPLPTSRCTETCRISIDADDFKENVLEIIDKYKVGE